MLTSGTQDHYFRPDLVEELREGARTLLGHFHFFNKSGSPFTLNWDSKADVAWTGFNSEQVEFMRSTSIEIKKRGMTYEPVHMLTNVDI